MANAKDPTGPTLPTIKRLFALSGNRCAFPGCELPVIQAGTVTGEICHIQGSKPDSARYHPEQPVEERHGYENLILLCAAHHKIIDTNPKLHSVEQLKNMKASHERQEIAVPDAEAEGGAQLLLNQSVTSIGQTGGVTTHSLTINFHEAPPDNDPTHRSPDKKPEDQGHFHSHAFFEGGSYLIARTPSLDTENRVNDFMYWHDSPSAWLRIIPSTRRSYRRAELLKLLEQTPPGLRPLGVSNRTQVFSNVLGATVVGIDENLPETIATRITQVMLSGEIWGLNRLVIESVTANGLRTHRIRWPALQQEFESALANYLQFATNIFPRAEPVTVVAGLAHVLDAEFVREKSKWYTDPPRVTRCLQQFVCTPMTLQDLTNSPGQLMEPFYDAVFDACTLDYSEERSVHIWPK